MRAHSTTSDYCQSVKYTFSDLRKRPPRSLRGGARPKRRSVTLTCAVIAMASMAPGCGSALRDDVVALFDEGPLADLSEPSDGVLHRGEVLDTIARANSAGVDLRVVVVARGESIVPAKQVVDRYGGTALTYGQDQSGFEAFSDELALSQVQAAVAEGTRESVGASIAGFVGRIEREGIQERGRFEGLSLRPNIWWLVVGAAVFMLWQLRRYLKARRRASRRLAEFTNRRDVLSDWAAQLPAQIAAVDQEAGRSGSRVRATVEEVRGFASTIGGKLENASNLGELDAAEMRIGRAFIKLREARKSLSL